MPVNKAMPYASPIIGCFSQEHVFRICLEKSDIRTNNNIA